MERYFFEGSFEEIGLKQGVYFKKLGFDFKGKNIDRTILNLQFKIYKKFFPEFLLELKGIARGGGYDYENVAWAFIGGVDMPRKEGCSIFGIKNGNGIFVGRNYDHHYLGRKNFALVKFITPGKYSYFGISDRGIWLSHKAKEDHIFYLEDAINEKGLFIGLTGVHHKDRSYGLFSSQMIRLVAQSCASVGEAVKIIKKTPFAFPKTFFIADKSGRMVVIEHTSKKIKVRSPDRDILIQTNHYVDKKLDEEGRRYSKPPSTSSELRYFGLKWYLEKNKNIIDKPEIKKLLFSDRFGVFQRRQNNSLVDTIWSLVLDMKGMEYNMYWNELKTEKPRRARIKF